MRKRIRVNGVLYESVNGDMPSGWSIKEVNNHTWSLGCQSVCMGVASRFSILVWKEIRRHPRNGRKQKAVMWMAEPRFNHGFNSMGVATFFGLPDGDIEDVAPIIIKEMTKALSKPVRDFQSAVNRAMKDLTSEDFS